MEVAEVGTGLALTIITVAVVGVTELVNRVRSKDYKGATTIFTAALAGGIVGFFGVEGFTVLEGVIAGLAAVGVHTTARQVG